MAVKDLVALFDVPPSSEEREGTHVTYANSPPLPPSSPARFFNPTKASRRLSNTEDTPLHSIYDPLMTIDSTDFHGSSALMGASLSISTDKRDGLDGDPVMTRSHQALRRKTLGKKSRPFGQNVSPTSTSSSQEVQGLSPHRGNYSVGSIAVTASLSTTALQHSIPSTSTVRLRKFQPHTPIPATTVFARNAVPLSLPKLDCHIASLPPPSFCPPKAKGKKSEATMFPPMDRLAACKKSIEDLENNSSVTPGWRNRRSILSSLVNIVLGFLGSSVLSTFYSLQGLSNTVQIFGLILSTIVSVGDQDLENKWRQLFLGTIPNILALNFTSTLVQSLSFLLVFMAICSGLLYCFRRSASRFDRYYAVEGLQRPVAPGKQWGLVTVIFLLTVIYLPLSTMAIHVLVWSQDLWVVPNPYVNATSSPTAVPALGASDQFRDAMDFCWTTTMKKNEVNFAPVVIIISVVVVFSLTVWFPISLRQVIEQAVPKVDPYTELGRRRNESEMDREYQRLLTRDNNPFAFLYSGFRRGWGTFQSTYLLAKLSTLLIIAVIDPDNCLFRSLSRTRIFLARQILLLISTIAFFLLQCFLAPFMDTVNNASEWTSRLNYVLTATVSLGVALDIPGKKILSGPILYIIYIVTYGMSIYFTVINLGISHRFVKRLTRRIDFSVDIFSPHLDVTSSSPHTKRRIWQESITTLFLTRPECAIPERQQMLFAQARDSDYPPYLLDFCGSPGERHVENLKILREVGSMAYSKAVALISGPDCAWFRHVEDEIQRHFVGPDCYWKHPGQSTTPGCMKFFGNAWWIPFPPTLVIRYDDGPHAALRDISELEAYISQNSSPDIQKKRQIRISMRALEGQTVFWPYEHKQPVGSSVWCCATRRYKAQTTILYNACVIRIKRRGHLIWQDLQFGSGFEVELLYGKNVKVDGGIIGLNDDYDLTQPLARFLALNQDLIFQRVSDIEAIITGYRRQHRKECRAKARVLTYRFLSFVYDCPRDPIGLAESSIEFERDLRVRQLMVSSEAVLEAAYQRLSAVSSSELATWWYIFWDDLWRRNYDTVKALTLHEPDFNPHYRSSIAYTPLPRVALETFLIQRGLMSKRQKWGDVFHPGFLNKLYLRLNETVFRGSSRAVFFHVGDDTSEHGMEEVDLQTRVRPSTIGTGGGTDYDQATILGRPTYRWEQLLGDPLRTGNDRRRRWFAKMGAWFGVTPHWNSGDLSKGVSLDVRLDNGRYVLIDDEEVMGQY